MTDGPSPNGMPRWVKLAAIVAAIVALLAIAVMLVGSGGHSSRRHGMPGAEVSALRIDVEMEASARGIRNTDS